MTKRAHQGNHHRPDPVCRGNLLPGSMEIFYFAYGSNLRSAQMQRLCPGHVFLGPARLADHWLAFTLPDDEWQGGVADVRPSAGDEVWGALYRLETRHLRALDTYEGFDPNGPVEANEYVRRLVEVDQGGTAREAWCYFVRTPHGHVAPSDFYRAALIEGATERGLPPHYLEAMRQAFEDERK
jgi:gamma-glutamylcyclotransferase